MVPPARTALASWGALRRAAARPLSTTRRLAKKPPAQKPPILEKPAKFNPPSHGSRLAKKQAPRHYGGPLPKEEVEAQARRDYPTMMAPEGTFAHWFWTNRLIHVYIMTVCFSPSDSRVWGLTAAALQGTLFSLGIATYFMNFAHTSPFKNLLPPVSDMWSEPITFTRTWMNVMSIHFADANQKAFASRSANLDDVLKRQAFQKAHGTEKGPMERYFGFGKRDPDEDKKKEAEVEAAKKGEEAR